MRTPHGRQVTLVAAGSFALILAALLRLYVYPHSALHPREPYPATVHLSAAGATYFDWATLRLRVGEPVYRTAILQADPFAGDGDTAVWTELTTTNDRSGARIDYQERKVGFDRRTGVSRSCCEEYVGARRGVRQAGLAFRWPIDARPVAYPFFDPVTLRETRMRYTGEQTVRGLRVHRYEQDTAPVRMEDVADPLPGRILGLPGSAVRVARFAETSRVYWVEPRSGLPIRVEEHIRQTLRTADDQERLVVLDATFRTAEQDVELFAAVAGDFAAWARAVETTAPAVLAGLGAVMLAASALPGRRRRSAAAQDEQEVPGDDLPEAGDPDHGAGPARVVAGQGVDDVDR
ncbi:hypothetical protein Aros01_00887 [Streptosporangium roseum]|uniref:DUF3068 domain-containing protein n=1 Tax=Streptosporangium roseum (strain ATCC 12428 / DSM 43021 / JCM 3005 / KCTC 9067 / NCIMB 10171 / NRRL 2505 / NI 9100) TaxID=479432 RepID=D2AQC2_STRRD|nr:hypothetical protein Sros_1473 [Streptosporangium roseum DSM 43021]